MARAKPWPKFRQEIESMYKPPAAARASWHKVRQCLDELERLGVEHTGRLDAELVRRYVAGRPPGESPHTRKAMLSTLRRLCSIAEERRWLACSPFRLKRMSLLVRTRPPGGKRCPTAEEVRRLLELLAAEASAGEGWQRWRARRLLMLVQLVALAGLRASEALRLQLGDIDLVGGTIHVRPHGKTLKNAGSEAIIAMPAALRSAVAAWLPFRLEGPESMSIDPALPWLIPGATRRGPWEGGSVGRRPVDQVRAAGERAGVAGVAVTLQSLRRAFVTHSRASGVPSSLAAQQCRHSEQVATDWYLGRELDSLKGALEGFSY